MALKMSWERQKDVFAIAASNDNHALAELRCAVIHGVQGKLFKNPCSQAELNKIVPFGFSLQRQKMVFFCH